MVCVVRGGHLRHRDDLRMCLFPVEVSYLFHFQCVIAAGWLKLPRLDHNGVQVDIRIAGRDVDVTLFSDCSSQLSLSHVVPFGERRALVVVCGRDLLPRVHFVAHRKRVSYVCEVPTDEHHVRPRPSQRGCAALVEGLHASRRRNCRQLQDVVTIIAFDHLIFA